ncbi:MAG: CDP-glycerol glycerophosphotransferase family protein [Candidatus Limnocylindrales bacterium]
MRNLLRSARIAAVRLGAAIGGLFPVRRTVVLATQHAHNLSGNLAFIRDELARRDPPIRVVVIASAAPRDRLERIWTLTRDVVAGYRLATARVFVVDDYYFPRYAAERRPGTTTIQVWHASGAFKRFGYSVLDRSFGADEEAVRRLPIHTNYDVCLVSSMNVAPAYADAFHQPLERFTSRIGIPRTDILFGEQRTATIAAAIRERYAIPLGRRVILYAPTFRGESIRLARTPQDLDLGLLRQTLGADHVVLLRLHPFVRAAGPIDPSLSGFVIDVSAHPDINELMLVSDILVSDYSSAIYEFSLLGRPMAFFAPDQDVYEGERGFYFEYRTGVPGPVFETSRELADFLRAGVFDLDRVARFRDASFDVADGRATARFVDELVLPALADGGSR